MEADKQTIKSPALEATQINANYSQQVVDHSKVKVLSPTLENAPSVASIYRKFALNCEQQRVHVVIQMEQDTLTIQNGNTSSVCILTLNHVPLNSGDYWSKLDLQLGAVLANEVHKNS